MAPRIILLQVWHIISLRYRKCRSWHTLSGLCDSYHQLHFLRISTDHLTPQTISSNLTWTPQNNVPSGSHQNVAFCQMQEHAFLSWGRKTGHIQLSRLCRAQTQVLQKYWPADKSNSSFRTPQHWLQRFTALKNSKSRLTQSGRWILHIPIRVS